MYKLNRESTFSDTFIGIDNTLLTSLKVSQVKLFHQGRLPDIDNLMRVLENNKGRVNV